MAIRISDFVLADASGRFTYQVKKPGLFAQTMTGQELLNYDDKYVIKKFNGNFLWLREVIK